MQIRVTNNIQIECGNVIPHYGDTRSCHNFFPIVGSSRSTERMDSAKAKREKTQLYTMLCTASILKIKFNSYRNNIGNTYMFCNVLIVGALQLAVTCFSPHT